MDGKITDAKNLVFVLAFIFIALFVGISFVNAFAAGIILAVAFLILTIGVFTYGFDEKDL